MAALDRTVVAWMEAHRSTITNEALTELGVSVQQRDRLVAAGVLTRIVSGGYRFAGVEPDELMRCAALCTARPAVVIGGPTAARLWELRRAPRDGLIHVVAPRGSHPCAEPWVRTYRSATLPLEDAVERADGVRLTSPPRTLVDLVRYVDDSDLASAIEHGLQRGLCSESSLARVATRLAMPGRPWVCRFQAMLAARHPGPAAESEWERRVVDALVERGVADLERQVWVPVPGRPPVRVDAAIRAVRWRLEIDVHPSHLSVSGASRDRQRDRLTAAMGWVTERVGEDELRRRFPAVVGELVRSIERRRQECVMSIEPDGRA